MTELKILLVDDEQNILKSLFRSLRNTGFTLLSATSGETGLTILEENDIDLVISDYRMPGMAGDEFLAKVKSKFPHIKRIMLSGYSSLDGARDVLEDGIADQLITKPWDTDELVATINKFLKAT